MKTPFRNYVSGTLKAAGRTVEEIAQISGISRSTMYRYLKDPDTMPRAALRALHKYGGISYEELMERR